MNSFFELISSWITQIATNEAIQGIVSIIVAVFSVMSVLSSKKFVIKIDSGKKRRIKNKTFLIILMYIFVGFIAPIFLIFWLFLTNLPVWADVLIIVISVLGLINFFILLYLVFMVNKKFNVK